MFVSNGTIDRVMVWCTQHKGHQGNERGWPLKALGEMVELCIASGGNARDISSTVASELTKADERGDIKEYPEHPHMAEEVADVLINLIVFCRLNNIDPESAVLNKLPVIEARQWKPDADGVLRRP
jgi:NTP pyrophosphatase (non-canonical NTP hydrolase)